MKLLTSLAFREFSQAKRRTGQLKKNVSREDKVWIVTGEGIDAMVHGSIKYGPNGAINGKGAKKYRKEILIAVEEFRKRKSDAK